MEDKNADYDKGFQEGYLAAKKNDETIILKLQKTIDVLLESIDELRTERLVDYR